MIGEGCNNEVVFIFVVKFLQVAYFWPGGLKVIVIDMPGDWYLSANESVLEIVWWQIWMISIGWIWTGIYRVYFQHVNTEMWKLKVIKKNIDVNQN